MIPLKLKNQLAQCLSKDPQIKLAYVIGSFASGAANSESDFDLAVVVGDRTKLTEEEVYNLVRKVSFPKDLDLSVIDKDSSPLFLFQVIKGECIYNKSELVKARFEAFVLHNYYDNAHMRNIYYSYLKEKFPYKYR